MEKVHSERELKLVVKQKIRCYVTKQNSESFPYLTKFIEELRSKEVHNKIGSLIGKDLSNSYVRLEVICDREGFWLKPHCDIKEKLMSSIVFINLHNESENLGTDFYDVKLQKLKQFLINITMDIFLQVDRIHGTAWKKKR